MLNYKMVNQPPQECRSSPCGNGAADDSGYCGKMRVKHSKKLKSSQNHKKDIEYPFIPSWNYNSRNDAHKLIIPSQMPIPEPVVRLESIAETI